MIKKLKLKPSMIGRVEILSVAVVFYGKRNLNEDYDFGALTLSANNREYILDVVQTFWTEEGGFTTVECIVREDKDTFNECKFDLTDDDLMSHGLHAMFYVGGNFSNTIEHITLFVKDGGMTKAINVKED